MAKTGLRQGMFFKIMKRLGPWPPSENTLEGLAHIDEILKRPGDFLNISRGRGQRPDMPFLEEFFRKLKDIQDMPTPLDIMLNKTPAKTLGELREDALGDMFRTVTPRDPDRYPPENAPYYQIPFNSEDLWPEWYIPFTDTMEFLDWLKEKQACRSSVCVTLVDVFPKVVYDTQKYIGWLIRTGKFVSLRRYGIPEGRVWWTEHQSRLPYMERFNDRVMFLEFFRAAPDVVLKVMIEKLQYQITKKTKSEKKRQKKKKMKAKGTSWSDGPRGKLWKAIPIEKRDPRRIFTPEQREEVLLKQNNRSSKTGRVLTPDNTEFDHIIPWAAGGRTTIDNCEALTLKEHAKKTRRMRWKRRNSN